MPLVKVNRRQGRPAAENQQILEAVHAALVEAFKIPEHDRTHLLFEHDAAHFTTPPDRSEAFTLVEIFAYPGRSAEAKQALFRGIAARLADIGVAPADLFVILSEPPLVDWSVRNGVSSAEARPPFKLEV
jgi:phenylpyruvate tautomerase PptA (4-oxalocrotonate tautomerase family)